MIYNISTFELPSRNKLKFVYYKKKKWPCIFKHTLTVFNFLTITIVPAAQNVLDNTKITPIVVLKELFSEISLDVSLFDILLLLKWVSKLLVVDVEVEVCSSKINEGLRINITPVIDNITAMKWIEFNFSLRINLANIAVVIILRLFNVDWSEGSSNLTAKRPSKTVNEPTNPFNYIHFIYSDKKKYSYKPLTNYFEVWKVL